MDHSRSLHGTNRWYTQRTKPSTTATGTKVGPTKSKSSGCSTIVQSALMRRRVVP